MKWLAKRGDPLASLLERSTPKGENELWTVDFDYKPLNKGKKENLILLSSPHGGLLRSAATSDENGCRKARFWWEPLGFLSRLRCGASSPFVNLAGRYLWHNAVLPSASGR